MIQKKICLLGSFSVGKTSLIRRFVSSIFDEKYLTTVGVKIDKKMLKVTDQDLMLMIWDLAGEDDFTSLRASYLRGTSACIIVIDGTRQKTAEIGLQHRELIKNTLGDIPVAVAINKADLEADWEVNEDELRERLGSGTVLLKTSAKTGDSVEDLFTGLASSMLDSPAAAA